ncbi:MAG: hypothetical protein JSU87_15060 [Gemmatimonadota bacterium]|nr:MAG: hypothetical protein JSU87_15060 [Gemmatimonadota bacterium]
MLASLLTALLAVAALQSAQIVTAQDTTGSVRFAWRRSKTLALTDIERCDYVLLLAVTPTGGGQTVYRATSLRIYE